MLLSVYPAKKEFQGLCIEVLSGCIEMFSNTFKENRRSIFSVSITP